MFRIFHSEQNVIFDMNCMRFILCLAITVSNTFLWGQDNPRFSNPLLEDILTGVYDPSDYEDTGALTAPDVIFQDLATSVSADTLQYYLTGLTRYFNRNSGADTISTDSGIGAARAWILSELQKIERSRNGQLVTGCYQFDRDICGITRHKNVMAILPGVGENRGQYILVEAHYDSRCEDRCDPNCMADGADDNGSGTALVMELARVMSKYRFDRTIIFMLTTGEEQGLVGARSFAEYIRDNGIDLVAVYNNDVVGGIICGETASPPGCPGLNAIDSINLRVYSAGGNGSVNKGLARFLKMQYKEEMADLLPVRSEVRLMSAEDRTGRGGDHIPFRELGYPAIRFTEANEHGNGNPATPDYSDRQHSIRDIIGEDTDGDGIIDEFFVDFNYLKRNTLVNATAISSTAFGPNKPDLVRYTEVPEGIVVEITGGPTVPSYKVGIRKLTSGPEFDTVVLLDRPIDTIRNIPRFFYFVSVAGVDENGIESLFTTEERVNVPSGLNDQFPEPNENPWELMQNYPNPFDEACWIRIVQHRIVPYKKAWLSITDLNGRELTQIPLNIQDRVTEVLYDYRHHQYQPGTYTYSLIVDGRLVDSKRMIYAY